MNQPARDQRPGLPATWSPSRATPRKGDFGSAPARKLRINRWGDAIVGDRRTARVYDGRPAYFSEYA